jgi:hypothetical protein
LIEIAQFFVEIPILNIQVKPFEGRGKKIEILPIRRLCPDSFAEFHLVMLKESFHVHF